MAYVNVNRSNEDQFYRYKMPSLIAKVEGKGNGIKTVIVNMMEIGKALQRPPSYPCKFFGCELGAQTQMDPKIGRYIVNGAHEAGKLQDLLDVFIKNFVMCEQCDNPETALHVQPAKSRISQVCTACGHSRLIGQRHKLATFILKNPPTSEESGNGKKDKKVRGRVKGKKDKEPLSPNDIQTPDDEFELLPDLNGSQHTNEIMNDDEDDWSVDTSKEAVKARLEVLSDGANALALNDDLEKSSQERLNIFYKFIESIKKDGGVPAIASCLPRIKAEAERLEVMDTAAGIMADHLYTDQLLTQIKQYRPIMLHFVLDNKKAQKTLIGAFEILVGKVYPALMPRVPHILKTFYDEDIIEEEVILEWNDKVSKKHVGKEKAKEIREKAKPFIDWLRTAEEESSDDEEKEDEDDVEVVYSEKATITELAVVTEQTQDTEEDKDEEDLDIDAI